MAKVTTLSNWFDRHGRRPLLVSLALVLALSGAQVAITIRQQREAESRGVGEAAELVSLALGQRNRHLAESLMNATRWRLRARATALCRDGRTVVSSSGTLEDLCGEGGGSLRDRLVSAVVPGFRDHSVRAQVQTLPAIAGLSWTLGAGVAVLMLTALIMARIQRRVRDDLLAPLTGQDTRGERLEIEEIERIRVLQAESTRTKVQAAVADAVLLRGEQLAHDIRSPIACLGVLAASTSRLDEEERVLLRMAIDRIRQIAGLLKTPADSRETIQPRPQLVSAIVESVLSEKRVELKGRPGLGIGWDTEPPYGLFSRIDPVELKRALSNLINNSAESILGQGQIRVSLAGARGGLIELVIQDTGKGIPAELLSRLTERGATFGKAGGSGLGLFHARSFAKGAGGTLSIASEVGRGTRVSVTVPACEAPGWFVPSLEIPPSAIVVALDDDPCIHQIWRNRLASAGLAGLVHATNANELRANAIGADLLLVDFELRGESKTGLDWIEELRSASRAILVTSRYEDEALLARCEHLGVRLLPKPLALSVPIVIVEPASGQSPGLRVGPIPPGARGAEAYAQANV